MVTVRTGHVEDLIEEVDESRFVYFRSNTSKSTFLFAFSYGRPIC